MMESTFLKKHPGLLLAGILVLWYFIACGIDSKYLLNTKFSNFLFLKEGYLGMKPFNFPLPETGILLFVIGIFPAIAIFILVERKLPKTQTLKYIIGVIGASFLIFLLMIPILILGELAYAVFVDKFCTWVSWLNWVKEVADKFTFKAKMQTSFIQNPIEIDMSLGGVLALYIGIPRIRKRLDI